MSGKLVLTRQTLRILTGVQLRTIVTGDEGGGDFTRYSDNDCGTTLTTIPTGDADSCHTCSFDEMGTVLRSAKCTTR